MKISIDVAIKKKEGVFIRNIYRYMNIQTTAGINSTEIFKSLYEIPNDKILKLALMKISANYFRTLNIDESIRAFKSYFVGHEVDMLCMVLKQGVVTGNNEDLLVKQEGLMLKKYFNSMETQFEKVKMKGFIIVIFLSLLVFLLISIPMILEMYNATLKIFV